VSASSFAPAHLASRTAKDRRAARNWTFNSCRRDQPLRFRERRRIRYPHPDVRGSFKAQEVVDEKADQVGFRGGVRRSCLYGSCGPFDDAAGFGGRQVLAGRVQHLLPR
jgi:hypothetical protein